MPVPISDVRCDLLELFAGVSSAILAGLYLRSGAAPAPPPSKTTIWRALTDADPEAFDVAAGTRLMNLARFARPAAGRADDCVLGRGKLMQVRLDGRAIRGSKDADGNQVRLLATLAGWDAAASVVAAQAGATRPCRRVSAMIG